MSNYDKIHITISEFSCFEKGSFPFKNEGNALITALPSFFSLIYFLLFYDKQMEKSLHNF